MPTIDIPLEKKTRRTCRGFFLSAVTHENPQATMQYNINGRWVDFARFDVQGVAGERLGRMLLFKGPKPRLLTPPFRLNYRGLDDVSIHGIW